MGVRVAEDDLPETLRAVPMDDLPDEFGGMPAQQQPQSSLGQAYDFTKGTAKGIAQALNPLNIYEGLRHPIQPMLDQLEKARQAYQQGNTTEALGLLATGVFPVLGPLAGSLAEAPAKIIYGETPEQRGEAFGGVMALPIGGKVAGGVIKGTGALLEKASKPMYQSALKPSTAYPAAKTARIVETGLKEAIPVSKKGLAKASDIIDELKQQIDSKIAEAEQTGAKISAESVASRVEEVKPRFNTVNPLSDMEALQSAQREFKGFGEAISPTEAQTVKQNTYRKLKDKSYGEQKTAQTEAEKALARGLKEELENLVPELKGMNARESALIGLNKSLERAVNRITNREIFGIGTPAMGGLGYAIGGAPGAATLAILKVVLDQPEVKSRIAIAVNRARSAANKAAQLPVNPALYQGNETQ